MSHVGDMVPKLQKICENLGEYEAYEMNEQLKDILQEQACHERFKVVKAIHCWKL